MKPVICDSATLVSLPTIDFGSIEWHTDVYTLAIVLTETGEKIVFRYVVDRESNPRDADCYSESDVFEWKEGLWWYVGILVRVYSCPLGDRYSGRLEIGGASLWGIESNSGAEYLRLVCAELLTEALSGLDGLLEPAPDVLEIIENSYKR